MPYFYRLILCIAHPGSLDERTIGYFPGNALASAVNAADAWASDGCLGEVVLYRCVFGESMAGEPSVEIEVYRKATG